jgi:glycosyltransferase involved in cell wall biosynthesis
MKMSNRVDVIVPCYNYARYLRGCVQSILSQSSVDVRVLILDDASPDDTSVVADELARADNRVECRCHRTNQGHLTTANEGLLEWAAAEYTLLISADDLLTPGALGRAVRLLNAHPHVGMACGRQITFRTEEAPALAPSASEDRWTILSGLEFLEESCRTASNLVASPTPVVRTKLQQQIGRWHPDLPHTADMEMWMRFAAHGSIGIIDADQALKRMHGKNMQLTYLATALGDIRQRRDAFTVLFRDWGNRIPECGRLEKLAFQSLGEEAFWSASAAFDNGALRRCQEFMEFALDVFPELQTRPQWARWQWKRRLGPKVWSCLHPWVTRIRRKSKTLACNGG